MAKARRASAEDDQAEDLANPHCIITREHAEFLQANTEAVTALEKRLQVVQQILDEVANELGWLARNIQDLSIGGQGGPRVEESVHCMECESEPIRTLAEALRNGWTELMLHEGTYMGMCPDCMKQEDEQVEATRRPATPIDAARELDNGVSKADQGGATTAEEAERLEQLSKAAYANGQWGGDTLHKLAEAFKADHGESTPEGDDEEAGEAPAAATPQPAPTHRSKGHSKQPLYLRMFMHDPLTALVRAVGFAGFPASEGPERMRSLIEKFGEPAMRAAADEIVEIDHTQNPPLARLTSQARQLAVGLLGRPPEAPPAPPHVPPSAAPEPSAQADAPAPASIKQPQKRTKQSAASRSRRQSNSAADS
jgi:hypothetical protein